MLYHAITNEIAPLKMWARTRAPSPRPHAGVPHTIPPIRPGYGHGHHNGHNNHAGHAGHSGAHHRHHEHHPWHRVKPRCTWWWTELCPSNTVAPLIYEPVNLTYTTIHQQPVEGDANPDRWYLGIAATVLPGKGIGIETIENGSPAALAGLQPGMVITRCNDVEITDQSSLTKAITASEGILEVQLLDRIGGQALDATVTMRKLNHVSF